MARIYSTAHHGCQRRKQDRRIHWHADPSRAKPTIAIKGGSESGLCVTELAQNDPSRWGSRRDHLVAELPSGDFRFIVLDVKTAFSDAASICQIGMTGVRPDNRIEAFATLVNLRMRFSPGPEQVAEAQDFHTACARISSLLSQHHLIQHGGFDKTAIHADCVSTAQDATDWTSGDSVKIARRAWPEFIGNGGHGLGHLEKQHGLSFEHHDAGEDAKAAVMVVLLAESRMAMSFDEILAARASRKPAA